MLDGDLSKGQDLWSFTEVCADWLMGFRKKTKQFQGRGSDTQRWNIIWLDYWVATINKTQPRVPRATREQEDLSQSLGILSEPSSKRMLVFPAQHTEGVAQHTEGQHCGGSDHPVPVCTYTTTEPWGTNPQQSAHQEHDHHPPVNQRDERAQGGTDTLLSSWTARNPAVGKLTNSSGGLNQLNTPEEKADNTSIKLHWTLAGLR